MTKYNQWEIKDILECTSKTLNSLLINGKELTTKQLEGKAFEYLDIYMKLVDRVKGMESPPPDFKNSLGVVPETEAERQKRYNNASQLQEVKEQLPIIKI